MTNFSVLVGDVVSVLPTLEANSFDAVLCDPPYGLEFMGREWDKLGGRPIDTRLIVDPEDAMGFQDGSGGNAFSRSRIRNGQGADPRGMQRWHESWAREAFRVLKPGAMLLAFGGTRTHHRLMCALEDAGFEIRDTLCWLYGSGFPKSLDISRAIDKAAHGEMVRGKMRHFREVRGWTRGQLGAACGFADCAKTVWDWEEGGHTPSAANWARAKAALQITDEEEAEYEREVVAYWNMPGRGKRSPQQKFGLTNEKGAITIPRTSDAIRWSGYGTALKPAWEPCVVAMKPLDGTFANNAQKWGVAGINVDVGRIAGSWTTWRRRDGSIAEGGNMPFAAQAHARNEEHSLGRWPANVLLDEPAATQLDQMSGELHSQDPRTRQSRSRAVGVTHMGTGASIEHADSGGASRFFYTAKVSTAEREGSDHPTMKPIDLTTYLAKLILPPQRDTPRRILVPFAGVGSEMIGAILAGWDEVIGIEKDEKYAAKARERITGTAPLFFSDEAVEEA